MLDSDQILLFMLLSLQSPIPSNFNWFMKLTKCKSFLRSSSKRNKMQVFRFPVCDRIIFSPQFSYFLFQRNRSNHQQNVWVVVVIILHAPEKKTRKTLKDVLLTMAYSGSFDTQASQSSLALRPCHVHVVLPRFVFSGKKAVHHLLACVSLRLVFHMLQVIIKKDDAYSQVFFPIPNFFPNTNAMQ